MMRCIRHITMAAAVLAVAATMAACGGPKTIPDRQLRQIFKDLFIANAYVQSERLPDPSRDSLDIYRPVLGRHGYTMADFEYTLANFSKRKSMKMSTVVDEAIRELEMEESVLRYQGSILDTIDARAQRLFGHEVLRDRSFEARRIADTSALNVTFPVQPGIYEVSFFYRLDSLDRNRGLKTTYEFLDRDGSVTATNNSWMSARRRTRVDVKLTPAPGDSLLLIRFGNYPQDLTPPNLEIDSVNIIYKPTIEAALDSLDRLILGYGTILDEWHR